MKQVYTFDSAFDASSRKEGWRTIEEIQQFAKAEDIVDEQAQTYRDVIFENELSEEEVQDEKERNHYIEAFLG